MVDGVIYAFVAPALVIILVSEKKYLSGSKGGAVVRAIASRQCGPSSNPSVDAIWVEFVVGSLSCSEKFLSRYSGFPLSPNTNTSKFQFDLERTDIFQRVRKNSLVLRG